MEAIGHAGTCLGILSNDGIVLAAERRNTNKLLDEVFHSEKIYKLNDDMVCSVAGITSDANLLTNELRLIGQRYKYSYGESIPCEQLVSWLCDIKQAYTQSGGKRPFGVSILYMGWDKHYGFQLYQSDPSGTIGKFDHPNLIFPTRKLWRLEGHLYWQQLECCCLHVEAGVQGERNQSERGA